MLFVQNIHPQYALNDKIWPMKKVALKYIDFMFESDIHVIELQRDDRLAYIIY
jgi:hypothetical protein